MSVSLSNATGATGANAATASDYLRVAIVGAGKMGQHHARAIARSRVRARVVAVADPNPIARDALVKECPEALPFAALEDLLAKQELDVVHVVTPPNTHESVASVALQAGCHVYVEKPFAESAASAERLIDLAKATKRKICAGHQLLYEPPSRRALELLPVLGRVVHIESYFSYRTLSPSETGSPLTSDFQLLDMLPHPIYLLLSFLEAAGPDQRTELTALDVGPGGTVHALVRRGRLTGTLVVTAEGRPIESYLRVVGNNGMLHADFVRGTVQRLLGPGVSTIDKVLAPFGIARQIVTGATVALARRFVKGQRNFPGLAEIIEAFYQAIRMDDSTPVSPGSIVDTTHVWEQIAARIDVRATNAPGVNSDPDAPRVLVTGGTGFLGKEVATVLTDLGARVRVVARRLPASWECIPGVEYVAADVAAGLPEGSFEQIETVVHCAAETAGDWEAHQRNSIDATDYVLRGAASAGVKRVIHVSSVAVLSSGRKKRPLNEETQLEPQSQSRGPYAWGKIESELLARRIAEESGLDLKVIRPGSIVDYREFEPPGALGRRVGNILVVAGAPKDTIGVVDLNFAARTIAWMVFNFGDAPEVLQLLEEPLATKRQLVSRAKRSNPDLTIVWLPRAALVPLSWLAIVLQKGLRPRRPAINPAKVYAVQHYDTTRVASVAAAVHAYFNDRQDARTAVLASPVMGTT